MIWSRSAVNSTLSLFPTISFELVVAVAYRTLWWKIDHGEQPLVHLGCAYCFVVAGFVAKFWEYFVEVLGFIFWVIWWVYKEIFGDSSRIFFLVFSMGFFCGFSIDFSWIFLARNLSVFLWRGRDVRGEILRTEKFFFFPFFNGVIRDVFAGNLCLVLSIRKCKKSLC